MAVLLACTAGDKTVMFVPIAVTVVPH